MIDVTITLAESTLESWRTILAGWYAEHPSPTKPDLGDDVEVVRACAFHGAALFIARRPTMSAGPRLSPQQEGELVEREQWTWDDERARREQMRRAYAEGRGVSPAELVQATEDDLIEEIRNEDIAAFDEELARWQQADRETGGP
jgi:hypothetical protein